MHAGHGKPPKKRPRKLRDSSIEHGHVGYLREAYHGAPYATRVLMPEAFDRENFLRWCANSSRNTARTPAGDAHRPPRLGNCSYTTRTATTGTRAPSLKSFTEFVELCERKERETGEPCTIAASY